MGVQRHPPGQDGASCLWWWPLEGSCHGDGAEAQEVKEPWLGVGFQLPTHNASQEDFLGRVFGVLEHSCLGPGEGKQEGRVSQIYCQASVAFH